jgi:hypothetical protein
MLRSHAESTGIAKRVHDFSRLFVLVFAVVIVAARVLIPATEATAAPKQRVASAPQVFDGWTGTITWHESGKVVVPVGTNPQDESLHSVSTYSTDWSATVTGPEQTSVGYIPLTYSNIVGTFKYSNVSSDSPACTYNDKASGSAARMWFPGQGAEELDVTSIDAGGLLGFPGAAIDGSMTIKAIGSTCHYVNVEPWSSSSAWNGGVSGPVGYPVAIPISDPRHIKGEQAFNLSASHQSRSALLTWDLTLTGSPDSDGDGIPDYLEWVQYGTDPNKADTDGDGLTDGQEVYQTHTNSLAWDSDGDGYSDSQELNAHPASNPLDPGSTPPNPSGSDIPPPPITNPPPNTTSSIGSVCGNAKTSWEDEATDTTYVDKKAHACVVLLSNASANGIVQLAVDNNTTVSDVLEQGESALLHGYIDGRITPGNADQEFEESLLEPLINAADDKLKETAVSVFGELAESIWKAYTTATSGPSVGLATEELAAILGTLPGAVALGEIQNGACAEFAFGTTGGKPGTDFHPVNSTDQPLGNITGSNATVVHNNGLLSGQKTTATNLRCMDGEVLIQNASNSKVLQNPVEIVSGA